MNASERRRQIVRLMKSSDTPLSGGALGQATGVSRQVIVQDIALLRTEGYSIVATARGYYLDEPHLCSRLFKVHHSNEQTEDELNAIVDLGGVIVDVMINHRIYGRMTAPLNIRSRRDVQNFMNNLRAGNSSALMNVTSGYHFHLVSAEQEIILDEIEAMLRERNLLAEVLPYEKDDLDL